MICFLSPLIDSSRRHTVSSGPHFIFSLVVVSCRVILLTTVALHPAPEAPTLPYSLSCLQAVLAAFLLLLHCCTERTGPAGVQECPEARAGFLQRLLHTWSLPLLWRGFRAPLNHNDLWLLPNNLTSQVVVHNFESKKKTDKVKAGQPTKPFSVLPMLAKANFKDLSFVAVLELATLLCLQTSPMVMELMISSVRSGSENSLWHSCLYAALLFCLAVTTVLVMSQNLKHQFLIGMKLRTALTSALYKKSLRLSPDARRESTVGEVVNLMSADINSVVLLGQHINFLWGCPLLIALTTSSMYRVLGWPALVGVASLFLSTPLTLVTAKLISDLMKQKMTIKDKRLRIISEIISGIKVLKLWTWEPPFMEQVLDKRAEETKVMKKMAGLNAMVSFLWNIIPFIVGFVSFACYNTTGQQLKAEQAFVTLAYLNVMRFPMTMIGILIPWVMMTRVSLGRINKFLNHDELAPSPAEDLVGDRREALSITSGSFKWGVEEAACLHNVNISVAAGSLTAVVGRVGAGKSSLLSALLGDMIQCSGQVGRRGAAAYVAQQAWVQNSSLKENVLFCREEEEERYRAVLESCALGPDLVALPQGDLTLLGERGVSLSGGQKQRVSLARAVYSTADTVLMDDPLAAVDAHVGQQLFEQVIGPAGMLAGRTRVLVTHGVAFLPQCDHIVVLAEGRVTEQGSYKELVEREGEFAKFLVEFSTKQQETSNTKQPICSGKQGVSDKKTETNNKEQDSEPTEPLLKGKADDALCEDEGLETGRVKLSVYATYLRALGPWGCAASLLTLVLARASEAGSYWWLKIWTDSSGNMTDTSSDYMENLGVYGGLGFLQAALVMVFSTILALTTLRGSMQLHRDMLNRVMRSPMGFFDRTPLGRIVNRFGKDINACDDILPATIKQLLLRFMSLTSLVVVILTILPLMVLVVVPVAICFSLLQMFVVRSLRQLQRLDSVSRSPIYSHFSESLSGASTIRAYGREHEFVTKSEALVDRSQRCFYPAMVADQLLVVSLGLLGNLLTLASALLITYHSATSPGSVGLVLTSCLQIPQVLAEVVRHIAQLETNIVAVERISEYSSMEQEAAWQSEEKVEAGWPESGRVEVEGLGLSYSAGGQQVLSEVTCTIGAGERVGVVGRTGAGKSSLALALFRLVEADEGSIRIDGRDIAKMGLHDLRRKLTIIPQDPVLFAGSLRMNLDPSSCHTDLRLWEVLAKAHLGNWVSAQEAGLQHPVSIIISVSQQTKTQPTYITHINQSLNPLKSALSAT